MYTHDKLVSITKYPFLKFISNNKLKLDEAVFSEIQEFESGIKRAKEILGLFNEKALTIYYIDHDTHNKLLDTKEFIKDKPLLASSPESLILLLLPDILTPKISDRNLGWRPQDLKMNCLLFSISRWRTYDLAVYGKTETPKRENYDNEEDYNWEYQQYQNMRWLHLIPIQLDKIFHVDSNSLSSTDEEFGLPYEEYGRDINGNIIDYLWAFILLIHHSRNSKRLSIKNIHQSDNLVSILSTSLIPCNNASNNI